MSGEPTLSALLEAIHRLELEMVRRFGDQDRSLRDRIDDVERRHQLDLKEFQQRVWEKFEEITSNLYKKTDGEAAVNWKGFAMLGLSTLVSVLFFVFGIAYKK